VCKNAVLTFVRLLVLLYESTKVYRVKARFMKIGAVEAILCSVKGCLCICQPPSYEVCTWCCSVLMDFVKIGAGKAVLFLWRK